MVSLIFQNSLRTGHRDPGSLFPNLRSTDKSLEHRTQLPHLPYGTAPFPDISCFPDNTLPGLLSPALVSSVSYPVHFVFLPVKFFLVHKWPPSLLQFLRILLMPQKAQTALLCVPQPSDTFLIQVWINIKSSDMPPSAV